jgi:hypothetical protein
MESTLVKPAEEQSEGGVAACMADIAGGRTWAGWGARADSLGAVVRAMDGYRMDYAAVTGEAGRACRSSRGLSAMASGRPKDATRLAGAGGGWRIERLHRPMTNDVVRTGQRKMIDRYQLTGSTAWQQAGVCKCPHAARTCFLAALGSFTR